MFDVVAFHVTRTLLVAVSLELVSRAHQHRFACIHTRSASVAGYDRMHV